MRVTKHIVLLLGLVFTFVTQATFAQDSDDFNFPFYESTISDLQDKILRRETTCVEAIKYYNDRILKYDLASNKRPPFNAIQELNRSAVAQARKLDTHYRQFKEFKGPLHCVPIVVKDNIDTKDMTTTSGTFALLGSQPIRDAFVVKALKDAGAIILAKSTMDELASGYYGVSSRHGRTGNAFDVMKSPGGSSSGSGVAVSLNFALAALGTDNSGSVRIPAAFNGIYGLRPTRGLVSLSGVFPRGYLDGVVGPMARNPMDLARVLEVITQADKHDVYAKLRKDYSITYTGFLVRDAIRGKRIGILRRAAGIELYNEVPKPLYKKYMGLVKRLKGLGAIIVDRLELKDFDNDRRDNLTGEVEAIDSYLQSFPSTRANFDDLCHSGRTNSFGGIDGCLEHIKGNAGKDSQEFKAVEARFKKNRKRVEGLMQEHKLDALLLPLGTADDPESVANTMRAVIAPNAGLPALTLLTGYQLNEFPVSMQLIGRAFDEKTLLAIAYDYDLHFNPRRSPSMNLAPITKKLTPAKFNLFKTFLGQLSYEEFLKENKPDTFSPQEFKSVYNQVLKKYKHYFDKG